uniref:Uncharacterized protein n=1 Tax=Anopheles minimus TaxID=112268 RepID=A0A182WNJ6_9DIPT
KKKNSSFHLLTNNYFVNSITRYHFDPFLHITCGVFFLVFYYLWVNACLYVFLRVRCCSVYRILNFVFPPFFRVSPVPFVVLIPIVCRVGEYLQDVFSSTIH